MDTTIVLSRVLCSASVGCTASFKSPHRDLVARVCGGCPHSGLQICIWSCVDGFTASKGASSSKLLCDTIAIRDCAGTDVTKGRSDAAGAIAMFSNGASSRDRERATCLATGAGSDVGAAAVALHASTTSPTSSELLLSSLPNPQVGALLQTSLPSSTPVPTLPILSCATSAPPCS